MNDLEFENLLKEEVSEISPDNDVVKNVTPWKSNMEAVLYGFYLCMFNQNISIVAIISLMLMLIGFRGLKDENKSFFIGYIFSAIKLIVYEIYLVAENSITKDKLMQLPVIEQLPYIQIAVTFIICVCIWRGIRAVERKAEVSAYSKSPVVFVLWYAIVAILALQGEVSVFVTVICLVAYVIIFIQLVKVYKFLDKIGYLIKPSRIKISNKVLIIGNIALLLGVFVWIFTHNQYTINWEEYNNVQSQESTAIKEHLKTLGVPENILNDLTDAELNQCKNAVKVEVTEEDLPLNEGREVSEYKKSFNTHFIETVYDIKELHMTNIAICISEEEERWKIITHFQMNELPEYCGTEALLINCSDLEGPSDITGRLLCEMDDKHYQAPYYHMSDGSIQQHVLNIGYSYNGIQTAFSIDENVENFRGYLMYEVSGNKQSLMVVNAHFYHQVKFVYPMRTALEYGMNGTPYSKDKKFIKAWSEVIFEGSEYNIDYQLR